MQSKQLQVIVLYRGGHRIPIEDCDIVCYNEQICLQLISRISHSKLHIRHDKERIHTTSLTFLTFYVCALPIEIDSPENTISSC